jgi:hypothetical protein
MAICPNGHDSASDDFCDICGMRIAGGPSPGTVPGTGSPGGPGTGGYGPADHGGYGPAGGGPSGHPGSAPTPGSGMPGPGPGPRPGVAGAGDPCPRCGTPRVGQFCEACGYNFGAAQPPWSPAPQAPPPASGLSSPSQPVSAPWPPPSAQPVPAPWPPPPSAPSVPSAPSAQAVPSRSSAPSVSSVPSVPTAQPVSPSRPVPPSQYAPAVWTAVVSCDRAYFESVRAASGPDAAAVTFPSYYAERRFRLTGSQMRIGRRSVSRGINPEIDLTGPPADPGISRLHAVLIAMPDGSWAVLDPGSANGTLVNGTEVPTGVQVPLRDGDRINLGAWTAIAVQRG